MSFSWWKHQTKRVYFYLEEKGELKHCRWSVREYAECGWNVYPQDFRIRGNRIGYSHIVPLEDQETIVFLNRLLAKEAL